MITSHEFSVNDCMAYFVCNLIKQDYGTTKQRCKAHPLKETASSRIVLADRRMDAWNSCCARLFDETPHEKLSDVLTSKLLAHIYMQMCRIFLQRNVPGKAGRADVSCGNLDG